MADNLLAPIYTIVYPFLTRCLQTNSSSPVTTTVHPQALLKLIIPDIVADRTFFREVAGDGLFTDIPAAES